MREIEIKAKVKNHDAIEAALKSAGIVLGPALKQHDVVYNEPGKTTPGNGHNFLRIRTENDTISTFTLKQTVKGLDKIEHETDVSDPVELERMIELMHFEQFSDPTKPRRKAKFADYEICLDEIDGLGTYIEIEKLCPDDADGEAVHEELWSVLESFGVNRDDEVTSGYDILMREKLGL